MVSFFKKALLASSLFAAAITTHADLWDGYVGHLHVSTTDYHPTWPYYADMEFQVSAPNYYDQGCAGVDVTGWWDNSSYYNYYYLSIPAMANGEVTTIAPLDYIIYPRVESRNIICVEGTYYNYDTWAASVETP